MAIFLLLPSSINAQTCGVFHKKINDVCIKFDVPSNAHLTYSGNSWDCNRGFKRGGDGLSCEEITIPDHATANLIGNFYCNSGFIRVGDECVKGNDVENGKFYQFGADFYCLDGYHKNEDSGKCEKIIIPSNARADDSSFDGWRCFGGYIKEGSECIKFSLPEHGLWLGDFWKCEQGFKKNIHNNTCEKITIPENAHSADTFDGWACNDGYTKNYRKNRCDIVR